MDEQEKNLNIETTPSEEIETSQVPETAEAASNENLEDQAQQTEQPEEKEKKGFKVWWQNHKPSKRRLIQLYAALLYNVNFKGFFTGTIYTGDVKGLCVPGLNCYSCPGASGACPLGALQNALAHRSAESPNALYYVVGIVILFGLLLGRTICGFLCPVGLGQELLYKVKTPKLKKSRVTYILSYFKYVLLAALVIAVPLLFALSNSVVPGFCKYICPAGTFGGAIGLLLHPGNASYYAQLGVLFTWKFVVMVVVVLACIFIYRAFCRFLCPLGAIYGFFNKIALLGVKLDKNKCTDCGLCVAHCKMDIKHVGDHECINCGECISVCPAKAIRWKGSKLLLHTNAVEAISEPAEEEKPLANVLESGAAMPVTVVNAPVEAEIAVSAAPCEAVQADGAATAKKRKKRGRAFWLEAAAWTLALLVFAGAFVYYNFIDKVPNDFIPTGVEYRFSVAAVNGEASTVTFTISAEESVSATAAESEEDVIAYGEGTQTSPYVLKKLVGDYTVELEAGAVVWYSYSTEVDLNTVVKSSDANCKFELYGYTESGELEVMHSLEGAFETQISLSSKGIVRGYEIGNLLYDFTLNNVITGEAYTLSEHRGKVVVINFWFTTCGPCVAELPFYQQALEKYGDEIEVVAIHRASDPDNAIKLHINETVDVLDTSENPRTWAAWDITWLKDTGGSFSEIYTRYGGSNNMYPMTVIVDSRGFVTFHRLGSVDAETLETQIEAAIAASQE